MEAPPPGGGGVTASLKSFLILVSQGEGTGQPTLCGFPHREQGPGMVAGFPPFLLETQWAAGHSGTHHNPNTREAEAGGSL